MEPAMPTSLASMESIQKPLVLMVVIACTLAPLCVAGETEVQRAFRFMEDAPHERELDSYSMPILERRLFAGEDERMERQVPTFVRGRLALPARDYDTRSRGSRIFSSLQRAHGPALSESPMKRNHYSQQAREELYKRSSLNRLIQRLLEMNGQRFDIGRAQTIRFGIGGR